MGITYEQERTKEQRAYDDIVLENVKRGLAWLEKTHGPGWEDKIDLETLDISLGSYCVCGQVFRAQGESINDSGFSWVLDNYPEISENVAKHGFGTNASGDSQGSMRALKACWKDVLTPRVSSVDPAP